MLKTSLIEAPPRPVDAGARAMGPGEWGWVGGGGAVGEERAFRRGGGGAVFTAATPPPPPAGGCLAAVDLKENV